MYTCDFEKRNGFSEARANSSMTLIGMFFCVNICRSIRWSKCDGRSSDSALMASKFALCYIGRILYNFKRENYYSQISYETLSRKFFFQNHKINVRRSLIQTLIIA